MTRKGGGLFPEPEILNCGCEVGGGRESGPSGKGKESPPTGVFSAADPAARIPLPAMAAHDELMKALERIRELEAELAKEREMGINLSQNEMRATARAERAEAALEEMGQRSDAHLDRWKKTEARVKELEGMFPVILAEKARLQKALHARDERSYPRP